MTGRVGLWIDHEKAIIVEVSGETEEITRIESNVDRLIRNPGTRPEVKGEDQRDRRFMEHLSKYYDEVIENLRDAKSVLILGPGEAKGEFAKQLQQDGFKGKIVGVEAADKMIDSQIVARVRQQFAVPG